MVDIAEQVDYWRSGSEEDFAAAMSLLEKSHLRHSLYFAHLALDKMLKAHVARQTKDIPPRIHNLLRLAELAKLAIDDKHAVFLRGFDMYQLAGRYPDSTRWIVTTEIAAKKLNAAGDFLEWLKAQL